MEGVCQPHEDSSGYLVVVPDLPGCIVHGDSLADAMALAMDAASAYVLNELAAGRTAPVPSKLEDIQAKDYPNGLVNFLLVDLESYNARQTMQEKKHRRNELQKIIQLYVEQLKGIYGEDLLQVSLFGSYARGDYGPDSDIDILVVIRGNDAHKNIFRDQLSELTMDFNMEYDIWIEVIAMAGDYFQKWKNGDPFLLNVAKDEVRLYGQA